MFWRWWFVCLFMLLVKVIGVVSLDGWKSFLFVLMVCFLCWLIVVCVFSFLLLGVMFCKCSLFMRIFFMK